ncbi:WD40-repeat-containing domain protein [Dichotomocladium elegans]|nr:WD40-repeat-containing domain protein [Dichotomocladium elegans]
MTDRIHTAVLQFLLTHGYKETQEAFVKEAGDKIDFEGIDDLPPLQDSFNDTLQKMTRNFGSLDITQRPEDFEDGDNQFFSTLVEQHSTLHTSNILAIAVDPHTRRIATSSTNREVKLITKFGVTEREYRHHQAPVLSIEFHPSEANWMLTASMDGTAVLVDTTRDGDDDKAVVQRFKDHRKYVVRAIFSPVDGRYMATASYDRTVNVYEYDQGLGHYRLIHQLGPFIGNVEAICFVENAVLVVGVRNDNYLHYIHIPESNTAELRHEKCNMNANNDDWVSFSPVWLSVSPDGRHVLCSTDQSTGRLILFKKFESTQVCNYYDSPSDNQFATRRHAWHPSGHYFYVSGADDHSIRVIETKTGKVVGTLSGGHTAMIRTISVDEQVGLVSGGYDHTMCIWSKPELSVIR